jgi:nitrite reductase/ring-hydroxylating ferredoxin subunit
VTDTTPKTWIDLCAEGEIADGQTLGLRHGEKWIALYRLGDEIFASDNICPHAFALLSDGWLEDGVIECPLHGALFDIRTGEVKRGPAECAIRCHPVRLINGRVLVELD